MPLDAKELARLMMAKDTELDTGVDTGADVDQKQVEPIRPRGRPLRPTKDVSISDEDIDQAIESWDEDVPQATGLLRALTGEPHG